ncbi:MAG: hypothetical protein JNM93_07120 [Bacteriovoracaceae bacterium]|nr:hypothetical protein [Bacteriovoracaceae bacterium]
MKLWAKIFLLISVPLIVVSCGDVGEGPGMETSAPSLLSCELGDYDFNKFFRDDSAAQKEIQEGLDCLDETLSVFIEYVESPKPNYLSYDLLKRYIEIKKPDMVKDLPTIEAFFILSNLIVGSEVFDEDKYKYISQKNLKNLLAFLKDFHPVAVNIQRFFDNPNSSSFVLHQIDRNRIERDTIEIVNKLLKLFPSEDDDSQNRTIAKVNMKDFLDKFRSDTDEETNADLDKAKSLSFLKRLFVGGDEEILTGTEMYYLVKDAPTVTKVIFDMVRIHDIRFGEEKQKWKMLDDDLSDVVKLLYVDLNSDNDAFLVVDTLLEASKQFKDHFGIDLSKHREAVINALKAVTSGVLFENSAATATENYFRISREIEKFRDENARSREGYTVVDILDLLRKDEMTKVSYLNQYELNGFISSKEFGIIVRHAHEIFNMGIIFSDLYNQYSSAISSPMRLTLDIKNEPSNEYEEVYFPAFQRIVNNYKFFQGDMLLPIYDHFFHRNEMGIIHIGIFEYVAQNFFAYFERKYPCHEEKYETYKCNDEGEVEDFAQSLTLRQIHRIILDLFSILVDIDIIIPGLESGSADNVTLLTDLFQYQSNGSGMVDVVEASEFAVSIFSALKAGDKVLDGMKAICKDSWYYEDESCPVTDESGNVDDEDCKIKVSPGCFRENFFKVLYSDFIDDDDKTDNLSHYLVKFKEYTHGKNGVGGLSVEAQQKFILETEIFSRTCFPMDNKDDLDFGEGDMLSMFGGLLNIESTLLKFDSTNPNNRMDPEEVEKAFYEVYSGAIEALVYKKTKTIKVFGLGKWLAKSLAKPVFNFLIKNGRSPNFDLKHIKEALSVLVGYRKFKHPAERMNIAQILKTISVLNSCYAADGTNTCLNCKEPEECSTTTSPNPDLCECTLKANAEKIRLNHCYGN